MSIDAIQSNTKLSSIKNHFVPSVVTSAVALMVAIPLTAALSSSAQTVASAVPVATKAADANACAAPGAGTAVAHSPATHKVGPATFRDRVVTNTTTGNGNNNSGNGNGNSNGSGAQANGNTQTNNGLVGVNAIVPVSVLNDNNILNGNSVDVSPTVGAVANVLTGTTNNVLDTLGL